MISASVPAAAPTAAGVLRAALNPDATVRFEPFGAVAYVGHRDDFFAVDAAHADLLRRLHVGPAALTGADRARAAALAALGVCVTDPPTAPRPNQARSLVGRLVDLPALDRPLLVNCFSTAHCPLRCVYCHADDLMIPYREGEQWSDVAAVTRTAALVPALVAVVTGGDPIVAPARAAFLIRRLAVHKRVVLDTSGAGDIRPLLPELRRASAHVRVSVDSDRREVHDRVRPVSPRYLPRGSSSFDAAHGTLRTLLDAGVPCSVQTVVGRHNEEPDALRRLRDDLLARGVRYWVLHAAVPAGKAERHRGVLPGPDVLDHLRAFVAECAAAGLPLDIRVTGTAAAPNSVLLIDSRGRLCVQRADGPGKRVVWPADARPDVAALRRLLDAHIDWAGHAGRYLNGPLAPARARPPALPAPAPGVGAARR
ncbi:radical SAM protein [Pilimelia anulata]|uniref:radical SAM protein n=1 Tax=Pilimelia anulata TaxID=53371 RepID=UPI001663D128|nr:radical SAM protein [Pilimelia anulata]